MANHTIAVFSPIGAAGTTLVACALAWEMSGKSKVTLLDFADGGVADCLGFAGSQKQRAGDQGYARSAGKEFTPHPKREKLELFIPSDDPLAAYKSIDHRRIIDGCRNRSDVTLIDLPHSYMAAGVMSTLEQSDSILFLTEYNWSVILACHRAIKQLEPSLQAKTKLVANREEWLPQDVLTECRKNLDFPISFSITDDRRGNRYSQQDVDYNRVPLRFNSPIARSVGKIAKALLNTERR